jgi:very-short-patch-repair endonuclease
MATQTPGTIPVPRCAAAQCGVFRIAQASAEGFSDGIIRGHKRSGRWKRVLGSAWTAADSSIGILQRCWAGFLTRPDCLIYGFSALEAWHALDSRLIPSLPFEGDQLWMATRTSQRSQPGIRLLNMPADMTEDWNRHGLPLTDPFEAQIDALATLDEPRADALFAWFISRGQISAKDMDSAVTRYRFRTGSPRLQRYRDYSQTGAASELEMRLHLLLERHNIRGWKANALVRIGASTVLSVDVLFEKQKLILEADGFGPHRSAESFQTDRKRIRLLSNAGYRVLSFTWQDIVGNPEGTIAEIRAALGIS